MHLTWSLFDMTDVSENVTGGWLAVCTKIIKIHIFSALVMLFWKKINEVLIRHNSLDWKYISLCKNEMNLNVFFFQYKL